MKKSALYVVLLLLLLIVAAVLSISRLQLEDAFGGDDGVSVSDSPEQKLLADTQPTPTVEPTPTPAPTPTPTPVPTPTPTPQPTPTPAPTPQPPVSLGSGSFRSDTGTALNLVVNWSAVSTGSDSAELTVVIELESYSLFTSALPGSIALTVNGAAYSLGSPGINYDGTDLVHTVLASQSVTVARGSAVDIAVDWSYRGSYGGTQLDVISAAGSAAIG